MKNITSKYIFTTRWGICTLFTLLLSLSTFGSVNPFSVDQLSDSSRISLLTASPGEELYSAFGHSGIRVTDYKNDFDVVFNYGTFDFDAPGFYTNFVKGKMRYMLSISSFENFMNAYVEEKRSVSEQELDLATVDKQNIFAFLRNNALPENREYYYDFFWDNCATRPRDVFEATLPGRLQYKTDGANFEKNKTMHDMLRIYVARHPWVDYGFDLILGLPCEVMAAPRDQTFLPDYLAKYMGCASLYGKPFVTKTSVLLHYPSSETAPGFRPMHLNIILLLLGIIVWLVERRRKKHFFFFDFVLFFIVGIVGLFFLSLWPFTAHYSVPKNLNVLWLLPTHAIIAFFLLRRKKPRWLIAYFKSTCVLMILILISWNFLPQPLNMAVIPLILLLTFRGALLAKNVVPNT